MTPLELWKLLLTRLVLRDGFSSSACQVAAGRLQKGSTLKYIYVSAATNKDEQSITNRATKRNTV